jgi:hypothetical protein
MVDRLIRGEKAIRIRRQRLAALEKARRTKKKLREQRQEQAFLELVSKKISEELALKFEALIVYGVDLFNLPPFYDFKAPRKIEFETTRYTGPWNIKATYF